MITCLHFAIQEISFLEKALHSKEGLEKITKLFNGIFKCIPEDSSYHNVFTPISNVCDQFLNFTGALNIIKDAKNIFVQDPCAPPRGILGWTKLMTMTIGHGFDTAAFLNEVKLINLGRFAEETCTLKVFRFSQVIPGIDIVKNIFIGISSAIGIIISGIELYNYPTRQKMMQCKVDKFENKLKKLKARKNGQVSNEALFTLRMQNSIRKYQSYEGRFGNLLAKERLMKNKQSKEGTCVTQRNSMNKRIRACEWSLDTWKKLKTSSKKFEIPIAIISIVNDLVRLAVISLSLATTSIGFGYIEPILNLSLKSLKIWKNRTYFFSAITGYCKFRIDDASSSIKLSPKPSF